MSEILENSTALKAWMEGGNKPPAQWRIGTEHEKLGFRESDLTPLPYAGEDGIRAMLEGLMAFGWQGKYESGDKGDTLVGLTRAAASVTLEPGGQLELSGAPLQTLHEMKDELDTHLREVQEVATRLRQAYLGVGFSPRWHLDEAVSMPKGRYDLMRGYMPKCGSMGLEMMYLSCTVQVNLDFADEADMVQKLRIGLATQPVATALFANSPFVKGGLGANMSQRAFNWQYTDGARTGMLPQAFEAGFGFEQYVDYALDVPMYFVIRDGKFIDCLGLSFRDFLNGKLAALPGEKPTSDDWESHLTTLFPEARVKRFIEMRGADSGSRDAICALSAFWVGLLYDDTSRHAVADMIADWTSDERMALYRTAPVQGLQTPFRGGTLLDVARDLLALAEAGLARRACKQGEKQDETALLAYLHEIAASGENAAARLRHAFQNEWQGDIRPVFNTLRL